MLVQNVVVSIMELAQIVADNLMIELSQDKQSISSVFLMNNKAVESLYGEVVKTRDHSADRFKDQLSARLRTNVS